METTLADVLNLPDMRECRVLNPLVGLDRIIRSVTIMDNPDILQWMNEYEALCSNGSALVTLNVFEWKKFFDGLIKKRSAGLFLKLNYYIDSIPQEAIRHAEKIGLPIIVVPNSYSWMKISAPIHRRMVQEQFSSINDCLSLNALLMKSIINGASLERVCHIASKRIGAQLAIFDAASWSLIASGTTDISWREVSIALRRYHRAHSTIPSHFEIEALDGKLRMVELPKVKKRAFGAYWQPNSISPQCLLNDLVIDQVNSALALCLSKERSLHQVEQHYYMDFLGELLNGTLTRPSDINARVKRLGRTFHDAYQLAVASIDPDERIPINDIVSRCKENSDPLIRDALCCTTHKYFVLFLPVELTEDKERMKKLCDLVQHQCDKAKAFGISQTYPIGMIRSAFEEARFAHSLLDLSSQPIAFYHDVSLLRFFARSSEEADTHFLAEFYNEILGPLDAHDDESTVPLKATLQAYFRHNGSISETALALDLHENTLRLRINKIEELSNRSLKRPHDQAELYLACLIDRFLD